jgi:capsid portal protein
MFQIFKSSPEPERLPMDTGRPFDAQELMYWYYHSPYHSPCLNVKTICILGDGPSDPGVVEALKRCVRKDSVFSLLEKTIKDLRVYGNAFWERVQVTQQDLEIYHMLPATMSKDKKGNWVQKIGKKEKVFSEEQVWHFREPSLLPSVWGMPDYLPLINDNTLDLLAAMKLYNRNLFRNNAIPDGIMFIKGGDLSPATQSGLRSFFRQKFAGVDNAAKFCIAPIPEGVEIQLERLNMISDGKFLELRDAMVSEVVSCHGVPPRLAGIMVPGSLGGGGEASGELDIFLTTRIKPLQNVFGGLLDQFFKEVMGVDTDVSFIPFTVPRNSAQEALDLLRG